MNAPNDPNKPSKRRPFCTENRREKINLLVRAFVGIKQGNRLLSFEYFLLESNRRQRRETEATHLWVEQRGNSSIPNLKNNICFFYTTIANAGFFELLQGPLNAPTIHRFRVVDTAQAGT